MKKMRNLAIVAFFALIGVIFTACPSYQGIVGISIDPQGDLVVQPGQTVTWNVTLTPDSTQTSALGEFYAIADQDTFFKTDLGGVEEARTFQVNYNVPQDAANGSTIQVTFVAVDAKSGLQNSVSVNLTVNASTYVEAQNIILTWNSTTLDNEMMLVLSADGQSVADANSTEGIIAYMYNGSENVLNVLASPNAQEIAEAYSYNNITYTTDDKQETYFKRVTGEVNWDDIDQAACEAIDLSAENSDVIAGNPDLGYGVSTLAIGDVLEFYNPAKNIKGFVKVTNFSTAKGNMIETTITVDVKYLVSPNVTAK